ncbi:hypothetical protein H4R24_003950 [Coemansia sp. RSA 988]|nr:hypothetical protein H4R24_003950 [Coemansia sp. RSA 988]
MAGILLESAIVLVPLCCAALYIIVTSNALLFVSCTVISILVLVVLRVRYHYSSGARSDLVVRAKAPSGTETKESKATKKKKNDSAAIGDKSDDESNEFSEVVQDAQRHCDIDDEVVERSGALLSEAVTTESTQYDMEMYGGALAFDHRCFYIEGRPIWVLATDFDYWRLPIAAAEATENGKAPSGKSGLAIKIWRRALLQIKAIGFNTVRIRFHWGFHSASKGKYDFSGGRNVNALLGLCEELGILVIACLGPFIGDDVQGGGYPFWLIQRDHIRLRHLWCTGVKIWDDRFAAAEGEWYDQIISMLVGHEVVVRNARGRGCILMVQLENELNARGALGLPLALHDETRLLARMARERVLRVPLATNNLRWPEDFSSFSARMWARVEKKLRAYRLIRSPYRADISGFTACDIETTSVNVDGIAGTTRGDNTPMVALELRSPSIEQGGSFSNQIELALRQGLSVFSLPGFFSACNRGNLASPTRTQGGSNDCAAVAADGTLSADARTARLIIHAARALEGQFAASDPVGSRPWVSRASRPAVRSVRVDELPAGAVSVRRQWEYMTSTASTQNGNLAGQEMPGVDDSTQLGIVTYVDGRYALADCEKEVAILFTLADAPVLGTACSFALTGTLGPRKRAIFAANILVGVHTENAPLALIASSKEIYARVALGNGSEAWICAEEAVQAGQLFFDGICQVSGHAEVEVVDVEHAPGGKFSFVMLNPGAGVAVITGSSGISLYIVLISQHALDTLVVGHGSYSRDGAAREEPRLPATVAYAAAWGADGLTIVSPNAIDLQPSNANAGCHIVVVSQQQLQLDSDALLPSGTATTGANSAYGEHPFIWRLSSNSKGETGTIAAVQGFERRTTNWNSLPWKLLPTMSDLETMDDINVMSWQRDLGAFAYQASDVGFNASHVLYRCQVFLKPHHITSRKVHLQLNVRHRCTVWINGINMSGHQTFHQRKSAPSSLAASIESLRAPGASAGADRWGGTSTYDVTDAIQLSGAEDKDGALNEVIVLVESFGVGAQAFGDNDAHTPRGLISAYWHGFDFVGEDHDDTEIHDHEHDRRTEQMRAKWMICGVDVTKLSDPYNSSGLPDEHLQAGWTAAVEHPLMSTGWSTRVLLNSDVGVQWWRWQLPADSEFACEPVHLRICGKVTTLVWVNRVLLAKCHPDAEESIVLLREDTSTTPKAGDCVQLMMYGWAEDANVTSGANGRATIAVELSLLGRGTGATRSNIEQDIEK